MEQMDVDVAPLAFSRDRFALVEDIDKVIRGTCCLLSDSF
jgi:hypothetical protein